MNQMTLSQSAEQIFVMSQNMSAAKEDLAWATYVLLQNTNTTSMLILAQGELCVWGYWKLPEGVSKNNTLDWFRSNIYNERYYNIKSQGTCSVLVQPMLFNPNPSTNGTGNIEGFVLLASSMR
ncbi:hypothetical protein GQ457_04G012850 [Hibiscus cannabinus]